MSQPDLVTRLRDARPSAPADVRERVRLLAAAEAPPPRRRLTWRLALVVVVPAAAAVVVAAIVLPGSGRQTAVAPGADTQPLIVPATTVVAEQKALTPRVVHGSAARAADTPLRSAAVPAPSRTRIQRYSTYLDLRVPTPDGVSDATKRAQRIATSLGGYSSYVSVSARGRTADAELRLRIPRSHVQEAMTRLASLGTIVGENVEVQDLQAQVNATDALIARLQRRLRDLRAQPQTDATTREIAALTARIQTLQRGRAGTVATAHYATVELHLTTRRPHARPQPHGHGPLHGLGVAFRWLGIGAVYALALGAPLLALVGLAWLAARTLRRRREDALLSRP